MEQGYIVVLVIASDGFQPIEYANAKKVVEKEGITVVTASDKAASAMAKDRTVVPVDLSLQEVDLMAYDGIFFIGGPGALPCLDIPESYRLISQARTLHKPYGAICISTRILAKAGALKGVRCTGWNGDNALPIILKEHGALFDDKPMITEGLVVTARDPQAAHLFGEGLVRVLTKKALTPGLV